MKTFKQFFVEATFGGQKYKGNPNPNIRHTEKQAYDAVKKYSKGSGYKSASAGVAGLRILKKHERKRVAGLHEPYAEDPKGKWCKKAFEDVSEATFGGEKYKGQFNPNRNHTKNDLKGKIKAYGWQLKYAQDGGMERPGKTIKNSRTAIEAAARALLAKRVQKGKLTKGRR